tara:strand:- start:629 stop:3967 length:3339 start_codon:yes stop_codon:yes gene_type:complete
MKKISYRHKKLAAKKDSKDLSGVYFRAVKKDAEKDLPESPLGAQESRRDYFERLNNLIENNKETYDGLAPFGRDAIIFVGTIPESELETLSKGDRLALIKWVASNYSEFPDALTLDNISKIRSFIDVHPEYTFLTINNYSPSDFISLIEQAEDTVKENIPVREEDLIRTLNIDQDKFDDSSDILSEENVPNLKTFLSEREVLMLKLGASLTDKVNNLSLILDFLFSENSDIEIKQPGDLEALYSFDLQGSESIVNSFNALDANQVEWHVNMTGEEDKASSDSGKYGYGYLTNIVVHQFGDGWKIVYLPASSDPEMVPWESEDGRSSEKKYSHDRVQEGDNNGLCLGSYSKLYNDNQSGFIYSLRDPSNKPIATIRIDANLREKNDFSDKYIRVHEIREKYNTDLGVEGSIYISRFFDSVNLDRSSYQYMAKDVSEQSLLSLIKDVNDPFYNDLKELNYGSKKSAEDMFSWINFLNKKRSDRKEAEKYRSYLKHYNSLIEARKALFNNENGLFFSTTSILLDESRARKYILNICRKIIQAGNGSFLPKDLIGKLFSKDIASDTFNKFYQNTLSRAPEYKKALEILSKNNPSEVYLALCSVTYNSVDYLFEYGRVSAKILLAGGKEFLDYFFSPLKESGSVFYDKIRDFNNEYKNKNVIEYIENFFYQEEDKFNQSEFFTYYFGNDPKIIKTKRNYINSILEEFLVKKTEKADNSSFSHTIMDYIYSQGEMVVNQSLVDENLAYNIAKYIETHIKAEETSWRYDSKSFSKYIFFKKLSGYKDELFEFSDEYAIESLLSRLLKGTSDRSDYKAVSEQFIKIFNSNIFSLDLISNFLVPKIVQKINNLDKEESLTSKVVLKNLFGLLLTKLSEEFGINLDDLINKTSVSNEEIFDSFSENPDRFFGTNFKDDPKLYELKKELALLSLKKYFDSAKGYHSTYTTTYESQEKVEIIKSIKGDADALDHIFDQLFSHIKDFDISDDKANEIKLRVISGKTVVMSSFANKLKEDKVLAKYGSQLISILSPFASLISRLVLKEPKMFYDLRMFSVPELQIDRAQLAKGFIEELVKSEYKYNEDVIPIILGDLGLSKQAKILYKYFVKNNYLDEAKSLISIY